MELTNNVFIATFQLLGLLIVCEYRNGPFVSLITWAQRPSIKMLFRSHQIQFILNVSKETQKDMAKAFALLRRILRYLQDGSPPKHV